MNAQAAIDGIRALGAKRVVTFLGYSDAGYEDEAYARELVLSELDAFDPRDTIICCGATAEGIGMVYPLALSKRFRTAGIVSSQAHNEGVQFSDDCHWVFVVDDDTWGGKQDDQHLSSTSQAMVDASDVLIAIGGGAIARDELEAGLQSAKHVRFHKADMNHARATAKALRQGKTAPYAFGGDAQTLFQNTDWEHGA